MLGSYEALHIFCRHMSRRFYYPPRPRSHVGRKHGAWRSDSGGFGCHGENAVVIGAARIKQPACRRIVLAEQSEKQMLRADIRVTKLTRAFKRPAECILSFLCEFAFHRLWAPYLCYKVLSLFLTAPSAFMPYYGSMYKR